MGALPARLLDTIIAPALKSAGIVWSEATFKDFMANPSGKVPGTKMVVTVSDGNAAAKPMGLHQPVRG